MIDEYGAVSDQAARQMAVGALSRSDAKIALAITGFAGEGGPGDEAGLVYIACAGAGGHISCAEKHFGDIGRGGVRIEALRAALQILLAQIGSTKAPDRNG